MHKTVVEDLQCGGACCQPKQPGQAVSKIVVTAVDGAGPPSARAQVDQTMGWLLMLRLFQLLLNFGFLVTHLA